MTPFRAAKKVVTSVTSVGTGLLPSKEQLGSIPVAGRILKHPVMDSTLTYIASKTTLGGKRAGSESKLITSEDAPYLKLNRKLIDQSITLATLAIEKEDLSKTMDDEAADDAFELYLAAIATLMHSLPIETCDPLRREALQSQLRSFLDEHQFDATTIIVSTATKDNPEADAKQRRRLRRRRHREYREQARSLIHQYSPAPAASSHSAAASTIDPIGSRRSSAPSQLQSPLTTPLSQQASSLASSSTVPTQRRRRRHRRRRGGNHADDNDGPTLGDTIISTAVESAIRLKQSPIPDVLKTCLRASRVILSKVDEKFHLQEKAWQLSKTSIEKAIELDEQYAIHEVVTETFFATVTGLVKAGIAYKETPSYGSLSAASTATMIEPKSARGPAVLLAPPSPTTVPSRPQNPQAILNKKTSPSLFFPWRRHSVIEEEKEKTAREKFRGDGDNEKDDDEEDEGDDGEGFSSEDSSSSCFTTSEDGEEDGEEGEESESEDDPRCRRRRCGPSSSAPYTEQVRQRIVVGSHTNAVNIGGKAITHKAKLHFFLPTQPLLQNAPAFDDASIDMWIGEGRLIIKFQINPRMVDQ
ncbi:hypothetical protein BGX23_001200 [Mortierella sp. AD031]|nr:hypothetical protein BGX23_001200 [Mortierella sp. AD031]